ncbi:MAG: hypothetical protein KJ593_06650 [Candidatus Omnitrophica bacterium]|nr:hypothetical protein [Candidatus Omnitrophota bacterium]
MSLFGIKIFLALVLPFISGYLLFCYVCSGIKISTAVSLAVSYGLGMAILAHCMLFLAALGIQFNVISINLAVLIFCLFFYILIKNKPIREYTYFDDRILESNKDNSTGLFNFLKCIFLVLGLLYVSYGIFYILFRSLTLPIYAWDSIATAAFNAKVFYYERSLDNLAYVPHASFPLQIPFSLTWLAINIGQWNDQYLKIIFPLTFVSFLTVFYHFLKSYTDKKWALLGCLLLFSSDLLLEHATVSMRDLSMLYYNCLCLMFLLIWNDRKQDGYLILASLCSGFGTFLKLEGLAYLIIHTILLIFILIHKKFNVFKEAFSKLIKFVIPSFGIYSLYAGYKLLANIGVNEKWQFDFKLASFARLPTILIRFIEEVFLTSNWNIIWFILLLGIIIQLKKVRQNFTIQILLLSLALFFGLHFSVALFTKNFNDILEVFTLSRLILHFFPLAVILIILLNFPGKIQHKALAG